MQALVYHGPGQKSWEDRPGAEDSRPRHDAIVRVDTATICGTDLHILKGDVPDGRAPARILGHEAVGTVSEVGSAVDRLRGRRPGARLVHHVVRALPRSAGEGRYGQCRGGGGWILGHLIDGVQAEYARVPVRRHLDVRAARRAHGRAGRCCWPTSCPTAYEVGVLNGQVQPGDTVAIVGAGPIGLAAILTAQAVHARRTIVVRRPADARLDAAKRVRRGRRRSTPAATTPSPSMPS